MSCNALKKKNNVFNNKNVFSKNNVFNNKCCMNVKCSNSDNLSYIRIDNYGAYVLRFTVTYYTSPSAGVILESGDIVALDGKRLEFPADALAVRLEVQAEVFLTVYTTFFDQTFSTTEKRCYEAYGATVNPYLIKKQCPQFDNSYFSLSCDGFLISRFYVTYITRDGKTNTLDSGNIFIAQKRTLYYPPDIVSVLVRIDVMVFIGVYETFFSQTYTTPDRRCFSVTGPALSPIVSQTECTV